MVLNTSSTSDCNLRYSHTNKIKEIQPPPNIADKTVKTRFSHSDFWLSKLWHDDKLSLGKISVDSFLGMTWNCQHTNTITAKRFKNYVYTDLFHQSFPPSFVWIMHAYRSQVIGISWKIYQSNQWQTWWCGQVLNNSITVGSHPRGNTICFYRCSCNILSYSIHLTSFCFCLNYYSML